MAADQIVDEARDRLSGPHVDQPRIAAAVREILEAIGEDPDRDGIADTPNRVAKWWAEFVEYDPGKLSTAFESEHNDQMVVVSGVRVWSLCEHHLIPFWADVTVAYLPTDRILGLSKFARLAHAHAHRPQVQERMVGGIADDVQEMTGTEHVAVVATGTHLCMVARGIKTDGAMTTSVLRGRFRTDPATRAEFLTLSR